MIARNKHICKKRQVKIRALDRIVQTLPVWGQSLIITLESINKLETLLESTIRNNRLLT